MPDTPVGTNSPDYPLTSADLGADIYCKVTATNASGTANADSNTVGPVTAVVVSAPALTNLWCWLKADAGVYTRCRDDPGHQWATGAAVGRLRAHGHAAFQPDLGRQQADLRDQRHQHDAAGGAV